MAKQGNRILIELHLAGALPGPLVHGKTPTLLAPRAGTNRGYKSRLMVSRTLRKPIEGPPTSPLRIKPLVRAAWGLLGEYSWPERRRWRNSGAIIKLDVCSCSRPSSDSVLNMVLVGLAWRKPEAN